MLINFFSKNFIIIQKGCFALKLKAFLSIAIPLGTFTWCANKLSNWIILNQVYIACVLTAIAIDHIIGSIYHAFKAQDFTFKKNAVGLIQKLTLCTTGAILFEVVNIAVTDTSAIYNYLKIVTRLSVVLYPTCSAFLNMNLLTNGIFPPNGLIKKIKAFNENLDLSKLSQNGPGNN